MKRPRDAVSLSLAFRNARDPEAIVRKLERQISDPASTPVDRSVARQLLALVLANVDVEP